MLVVTGRKLGRVCRGHDHFFKGGVPGPFTDAVDGYFRLPGPGIDGRQGVGRGQTQVIMAVYAQNGFVDVGGVGHDVFDQVGKFLRYGISHCIRQIDGGGPGSNGCFKHPAQKIPVAPGTVFSGKLNPVGKGAGIFNRIHCCIDHLITGHIQFVFHMDFRSCNKGMDSGVDRVLDGLPGQVDIIAACSGQCRNFHFLYPSGNLGHRIEISLGGCRKAGFQNIHTQFSSWVARRIFSPAFMLAPGDCSPSLNVVSKI